MRLSVLAGGYTMDPAHGDPQITAVTEDSRRVVPGALFVAVRGTADDGHRYVADALERGAAAVIAEDAVDTRGVPVVRVGDARAALADLAARYYDHPARELRLIGFTGTFGKTSTSAVLQDLLAAGRARPGVLGSLGARYGSFRDPGQGLTTPAPVEMHRALRGLVGAGADTVIMEVTSHALRLGRVTGLSFAGGLLAAILPGEHTDFHRSYEDYVASKRRFLDYLAPSATFAFDADNDAARTIARDAAVRTCLGFSLGTSVTAATPPAERLDLTNVVLDARGARFTVRGVQMHSPLLGRGHLRNVALALAFAHADGIPLQTARRVIRTLSPLRRRMERYEVQGRLVLDDTAGHPDSLSATFEVAAMLQQLRETPRVVVVYAIRGNRGVDINRRNARALSDLAAEHGAERVIITASSDVVGPHDRPSAEEIDAALEIFTARGQRFSYCDELVRAMRAALDGSAPGDLLLLLGAQGMNEGRRTLQEA